MTNPEMPYACERCGRADGLDAVAPNKVWEEIASAEGAPYSLLCLWCMDEIAADRGITCSVALHFAGRALHGTSQSDADQEHINRLSRQIQELRDEQGTE